MTFVKLFGSILYSTIWQTPPHVKIVWITMLVMKDRDGVVEASIPGLAKAAEVTVEQAREALEVLLAADPDSSTPDHEGRRISRVVGGWKVLNHDKYRDKLDLTERREKAAQRVAKHRAKKSSNAQSRHVTLGNAGNAPKHKVRHADTDADTDTVPDTTRPPHSGSELADFSDQDPDQGSAVSGASAAAVAPSTIRARHGVPAVVPTGAPSPQHGYPPRQPAVAGVLRGPNRSGDLEVPATSGQSSPVVAGLSAAEPGGLPGVQQAKGALERVATDPEAAARRRLVDSFVARCNAARAIISAELGLGPSRPIALQGQGERDLMARLRESADPIGDLDHVLAVATAEARATRELRWLSWSVATEKAWSVKLAATLAEAKRSPNRADIPHENRRPAPGPEPVVVAMTDEDRLELRRLAATFAGNPAPESAARRAQRQRSIAKAEIEAGDREPSDD